eukprot:CAMPEP_0198307892 /NCGR_PEP_ID=MMETSP1450-20131203/689_1 /TAXON_ID=753684 ORGANISM="Madagascaria erythrocladiodes, Strain CCMP3234" /NCGR_SAMPLE_ID=MMETSP1450 /ASSEMBLY_ACC=CAM_ASM_001115 /LENGTH=813 /DNA_ID=CAMNT_0044010515 /DNA_START=26 /DNA_END=2464 /DNA_ORIENTATION=+
MEATEPGEKSEVTINQDFTFSSLSPPVLQGPLYACARVVRVRGILRGAKVTVLLNGFEHRSENSRRGNIAIEVDPLQVGTIVNARQTFGSKTSEVSLPGHRVLPWPGELPVPIIQEPLFNCSPFLHTDNCPVGARLYVTVDGVETGPTTIEEPRQKVWLRDELRTGQQVGARVTLCEDERVPLETESLKLVTVRPALEPVPKPAVDESSVVLGNDRVSVYDLVYNCKQYLHVVGGPKWGIYGASVEKVEFLLPDGKVIQEGDQFTAEQELCSSSGLGNVTSSVKREIAAPVLEEPICPADALLRVSQCISGAVVAVKNGSSTIASASAEGSEVVMSVPPSLVPGNGDRLIAQQYIGNVVSPASREVIVSISRSVVVSVQDDRWHTSSSGEKFEGVLDSSARPLEIRVKTCCETEATDISEEFEGFLENEYNEAFGPIRMVSHGSATYEGIVHPPNGRFPAGNYVFVAEVPCNNAEIKHSFNILLTEIDEADASLPEIIMSVISGQSRVTTIASDNMNPDPVAAHADEDLEVNIEAWDRQGLAGLRVEAPGTRIRPTAAYVASSSPPIPVRKKLTLSISRLPRPSFEIQGIAKNFSTLSSVVRTHSITVNVTQQRPELDRVEIEDGSESEALPGSQINLYGKHLSLHFEETTVMFARGSTREEVAVHPFTSEEIRGVVVPRLADGAYELTVMVGTLRSNRLNLNVMAPSAPPPTAPEPRTHSALVQFMRRAADNTGAIYEHGVHLPGGIITNIRNFSPVGGVLYNILGSTPFAANQRTITGFNGQQFVGRWRVIATSRVPGSSWPRLVFLSFTW